jgi:transketolase
MAIVAQTVKAWGFSEMLGNEAHGKAVPVDRQADALAALDKTAGEVGAHWTEGELVRAALPDTKAPIVQPWPQPHATLGEAARRFGQEEVLRPNKMAPRKAYGLALRALGHTNPRVIVLDGDVRNSTYSDRFCDDPALHDRFVECKIAEQNMISCAGGLAAGGKIPFVSTFGKFLVRAYDQIEMALISRFDLKLVGSHVGASVAADGPSQMALTDVAFFRSLASVCDRNGEPVLYVLNPADAFSAYRLTLLMAEYPGTCYLRTIRAAVPFLYHEQTEFHLGGHHVLVEGRDVLIVATGYLVHEAFKALELLEELGMRPTLIDLYSLPCDAYTISELAREHQGRVLTLEDNYGAGFGSAVADALATQDDAFQVRQMYARKIPKSGRSPDDVSKYLGLSAYEIVQSVVELLERQS